MNKIRLEVSEEELGNLIVSLKEHANRLALLAAQITATDMIYLGIPKKLAKIVTQDKHEKIKDLQALADKLSGSLPHVF